MTKTINFSLYSSIKIGGIKEVEIINSPTTKKLIGKASNLLINPATKVEFATLSKKFDFIKIEDNIITIGAGVSSGKIISFAKKHNLFGFEFLGKIPGSLGGMVKMNAGLKKYEIFNHLVSVNIDGKWIDKKDIKHGYRFAKINGNIFKAKFKLQLGFDKKLFETFKLMRQNQPKEPSAGSCFKNPKGYFAAKLIEEAGLKGKCIGNMAISKKHANFLINLGNGTFDEALKLIDLAKNEVLKKFNIQLQEEIEIIR
jgi:UDP-N-acetylmuramate dehydrogenase